MTINEIKQRMKEYKDFYGGDLINVDDIDSCKTKSELKEIINNHYNFLEDQLADAKSHLRDMEIELGLFY